MNKHELLKQADYNFQRGNRELAGKYLSDLLAIQPDNEAAWMLLARVMEEKERKIECFERVLKINPKNEEAKLGLIRVRAAISPTLPLHRQIKKCAAHVDRVFIIWHDHLCDRPQQSKFEDRQGPCACNTDRAGQCGASR
ncbi:MAG: tetratricopeptide repeat protein [Chloroflexi bacterium]|nr:MAG: tetratricopeptide repeat protein [Chloroflexota bacterium]